MLLSHAPGRAITPAELTAVLAPALAGLAADGRRVLLVVPDATRTLPMPLLTQVLTGALVDRALELTVLVALGTHQPMTESALREHLGLDQGETTAGGAGGALRYRPKGARGWVTIEQHRWNDDGCLASCGELPRAQVRELSRGMVEQSVPVRVNRRVLESALTLLVGPVFPHELIGFSGGHKYLFPGVSGAEMVDATHWLGALITNPEVNGVRDTPPRAMIEAAADLVPGDRAALCLAVKGQVVNGLYLGPVRETWRAAVEHSGRLNVVRLDRAYRTVIAGVPERYEDLWTGSKCMTKLECVVADGGRLVLHGPHIKSPALSYEGGGWHERVGYHVRDWILAHRGKYADVPLAVLADLMQLPGTGAWSGGVETRRIEVVLATGIPEAQCRKIGLAWADPARWAPEAHAARADPDTLVVPHAGEILYRLADAPA